MEARNRKVQRPAGPMCDATPSIMVSDSVMWCGVDSPAATDDVVSQLAEK